MKYLLSLISIFAFASVSNAHITTQQEFTALNRIANLCKNCGEYINTIVFYDDKKRSSIKDMESIMSYAQNNSVYKINKTSDILTDFSKYNLVLVAHDVEVSSMNKIVQKVKGKKIITASTDTQCVDDNACLLGVEVSDSIRIYLNQKIFQESNIKFNDDMFLLIN